MYKEIERLTTLLSSDSENPQLNFLIGAEYDKINQFASAVSFYLKAAEYGIDEDLIYSCLLKTGLCFERQGQRDSSVTNSFLQAIQLLPSRPEAYFFMSRFYERHGNWQESYTFAEIGLKLINKEIPVLPHFADYFGENSFVLQKGVSAWWIGQKQESKDMFFHLANQKNLPEIQKHCVLNNFKTMGWSINKIAIILPVRDAGTGRSKRLMSCLESWSKFTEGLSDIHIIIDEDDVDNFKELNNYMDKFNVHIKPQGLTLMEKINTIGLDIAHLYKYICFIGDDIVFKTKWESKYIDYLSSVPAGLVSGKIEDSFEDPEWATHPCITSNLVKAVGFYGCPAVAHNYFDNYWTEVSKEIGYFKRIDDVVMDHTRKESDKDAIFWKVVDLQEKDKERYYQYKKLNFDNDIKKIKEYVGKM
jgi:tetratricopeptide (TPR) repeat protein